VTAAADDASEQFERALGLGYRFLSHRDRTEVEMRAHLSGRGVQPEVADQAVAELVEQGYLDDVRFAHRFAEDRRTLDHWGSERIERRLRELGIGRALAASARRASSTPRSRCSPGASPHRRARSATSTARSACSSAAATSSSSRTTRSRRIGTARDTLRARGGGDAEVEPAFVCAIRGRALRSVPVKDGPARA
jgi:regulatory protein